eukprot:364268-Chlamydomonas_euryale.AAC.18
MPPRRPCKTTGETRERALVTQPASRACMCSARAAEMTAAADARRGTDGRRRRASRGVPPFQRLPDAQLVNQCEEPMSLEHPRRVPQSVPRATGTTPLRSSSSASPPAPSGKALEKRGSDRREDPSLEGAATARARRGAPLRTPRRADPRPVEADVMCMRQFATHITQCRGALRLEACGSRAAGPAGPSGWIARQCRMDTQPTAHRAVTAAPPRAARARVPRRSRSATSHRCCGALEPRRRRCAVFQRAQRQRNAALRSRA